MHAAVDTLGHLLLALFVGPADEQERARVGKLAGGAQEATGESVEVTYMVNQGYSGERPASEAQAHGMRLEVVKHPKAKRGLVLLPAGGWWSATSRGHRGFGGWSSTTSGYPPPWPGCTSSLLPASSSIRQPQSSAWVHNTL